MIRSEFIHQFSRNPTGEPEPVVIPAVRFGAFGARKIKIALSSPRHKNRGRKRVRSKNWKEAFSSKFPWRWKDKMTCKEKPLWRCTLFLTCLVARHNLCFNPQSRRGLDGRCDTLSQTESEQMKFVIFGIWSFDNSTKKIASHFNSR